MAKTFKKAATLSAISMIFSIAGADIITNSTSLDEAKITGHEAATVTAFQSQVDILNDEYQNLKQYGDRDVTQETLNQLDLIAGTSYADPDLMNTEVLDEALESNRDEINALKNSILMSSYIGEESKGELFDQFLDIQEKFDGLSFEYGQHHSFINEANARGSIDANAANTIYEDSISLSKTVNSILSILLFLPMAFAVTKTDEAIQTKLKDRKKRLYTSY